MSLSAASPHAPDLSGRVLNGRYELHALIGEGSFGRVYRGRDRRLARAVAVKVIKPWWAEDPEWVRLFEREAQLMASVNDPRIVQIYDVGRARQGVYYVAELIDGESVAARLRRGPLPPFVACRIAEQLSRAVGTAHLRRIVHGDIKPANVLISSRDEVKVTDFGVAKLIGGTSEPAQATVGGTPAYMAPEQARSGGTSRASDVYSVGIVLYEMLAGRPPFTGDSPVELALQHLSDPVPPLPWGVPASLRAIVERALQKEPEDRYADGRELAEALGRADTLRAPGWSERPTELRPITGGSESPTGVRAQPGGDPEKPPASTLVGRAWSSRRTIDPAGRRMTLAAFAAVLLVLAGLVFGAILAGGIPRVRVPDLRGLSAAAVRVKLDQAHLRLSVRHRYSRQHPNTLISQSPSRGTRIAEGSRVIVFLSAGPAPVPVPQVVGFSSTDASSALRQLGLGVKLQPVPAFGRTVGSVTAQSQPVGRKLRPGSTVLLSVAEAPRWRSVVSFANRGGQYSPPFRILSQRWRIVYRMTYNGTCNLIFFCSGPTAHVSNLTSGGSIGSFGLNDGTGQTQTFSSRPGMYQVRVTPGDDAARWSAEIQDYY